MESYCEAGKPLGAKVIDPDLNQNLNPGTQMVEWQVSKHPGEVQQLMISQYVNGNAILSDEASIRDQ